MEATNTAEDSAAGVDESSTVESNSAIVPRVVKFGYKNFRQADGKWHAVCNICKKSLTDRIGVSSSFTK